MSLLDNKSALIYGGTGGIGLTCAEAFIRQGVKQLVIVGRTASRGENTARMLNENTAATVIFVQGDAATGEGAAVGVEYAIKEFGKIDILLSTAGGEPMPALFHTIDMGDITSHFAGPSLSIILPARAAVPYMMEQNDGVILSVASDAGKHATPGEVVIGAAMAANMMFCKALANEVKRHNVRVNCLSPSIVGSTALYDSVMADSFAGKIFGKAQERAILGLVEPEDLAQLAVYLASSAARKMTGQVISLNGGISMG